VLSGSFSGASDHARRADHRGDGAGRRHAVDGRRARSRKQGRVFHVLEQRKVAAAGEAGRSAGFELELLQVRGMMCKMSGVAKVDGKVVAEAEMGAVVRDK